MAHSVPENIAPTLAKFLPLDTDERYISRRPALICWRMGRSVKGTVALGRVAVADADGADGSVVAEMEFRLLVATAEGLTPAAAVATVVGVVVGVATGRGPDIGVSYRIYTVISIPFAAHNMIDVQKP